MPPGESPGQRVTGDELAISYGSSPTPAGLPPMPDSMVSRRPSVHDLPLSRVASQRSAVNTLDDDDAPTVSFHLRMGVRYGVLRERRTTARGATCWYRPSW
jgi:hypothetical protein